MYLRAEFLIPNLVTLRDNHLAIVVESYEEDSIPNGWRVVVSDPTGTHTLRREPGDMFEVVGTAPDGDPSNIEMFEE